MVQIRDKELKRRIEECGLEIKQFENREGEFEEFIQMIMANDDELLREKQAKEFLNKAHMDITNTLSEIRGSWLVKEANNLLWHNIEL